MERTGLIDQETVFRKLGYKIDIYWALIGDGGSTMIVMKCIVRRATQGVWFNAKMAPPRELL
jgi:hypothetical protein